MSEEEDDVWEYKGIKKTQSVSQNSEVISAKLQKTNDRNGRSQSLGNRNNRKTSEEKKTPKKQKPRQKGTKTPNPHCSVSVDENHVAQFQESISSTLTEQKKNNKKLCPQNARPLYEGYCPSCQMPFSLLLVETPRWHVTECLDGSKPAEKECPDGLLCTSSIPSHYKRYSHFLLAASRAGEYLTDFSSSSEKNSVFGPDATTSISYTKFKECTLQDLNNSQSMGKPSKYHLPLAEQYPMATIPLAVTNIKASSLENIQEFQQHGIQSIEGTKQIEHLIPLPQETKSDENLDNQHGAHSLKRPISEADFKDCDISYSPLSTEEEETTEEEEKEEEKPGPAKIEHFRKRLFDVINLEDKGGSVRCSMINKLVGGSHLKESDKTSIEGQRCIANNEKLNMIQSANGVSKTFSQGGMLSRVPTSANSPQLKHSAGALSLPVDYRRTKEVLESFKLSSAAINVGECGWGKSEDYNWFSGDFALQNMLFPSEFEEEGIKPFLATQSDAVKEAPPILNSEPGTISSICENRSADDNLYSEIEKGELCHTTAMPVFPNPVSKTLPCVSPAKVKVQTTPAKELKQMDIGVFFGLHPKAKMENDQKKNFCEKTQTLSPLAAAGKRPRSQKRKTEESVGELNVVTESSSKNDIPANPTSGGQRRWVKKFRKLSTAEEETRKKQCPFYKKIPGTGFVVDAFQYGEIEGCTAYFLTHFHSDHYGGLTKKFTFPLYCNKITGNLVKSKLRVQEQYIHVLPMDTECTVNGIKVVLLGANHCPGAAMILFFLPNGTVVLHTGDFRADPSMERYPFLTGQKIHTLYLDTTYCSPEYTFPPQQEVIQFAVNTAFEMVTLNPRTLVVCGTYSIGKEKVFLAIAEVLGSKVSMSQDKYKTLQCLESATVNSLITLDWNHTLIHLLPMMQINFKGLQNHLNKFSDNFDQILAFKPTGWTYSDRCLSLSDIQPQTKGKLTIYGIPYSEHSSFLEMKRFVQWLKPQKIIPTVNIGNWKSRNEMERHFRDWKMEAAGWK
ncbi:DNA cross-link repair 1A protein [Tiliqua scincoides]|uniref:DNA cross-link repair 1A protein n=1 Tax=Tiliqua scincoides TaxID=71010 RepID=UPI0034627E26